MLAAAQAAVFTGLREREAAAIAKRMQQLLLLDHGRRGRRGKRGKRGKRVIDALEKIERRAASCGTLTPFFCPISFQMSSSPSVSTPSSSSSSSSSSASTPSAWTTIRASASAPPKAPFRLKGNPTDPPVKAAWKPKGPVVAPVGLEAEVASLTAASFPALPQRSTTAAATAAAASYSAGPARSFIDIAREAHERTEAAKRAADQRALAEREQAARDARDLALRQSFHESRSRPVYRGGAGGGAGAESVDESYREPSSGGYNSSSYYAEEDGEEEKDVEEEEPEDDEGWTQ